jgi:hypothetical protein
LAIIVNFESGSHWYTKGGEPRHDADLRVARKALLYPSITTVDKAIFKNEFLERYKLEQYGLAAAANQRMPHESESDYASRLFDISLTHARNAAEFGKELHDAAQYYPQLPINQFLLPWVARFEKWWNSNQVDPIAREIVLVDHDLGLAGRTDMICQLKGRRTIVDYKTQGVKKDDKGRKKPAYYDSWVRQLAFYAGADAKATGLWPDLPDCVSLVLDSDEGGDVYDRAWTKEEILSAYEDMAIGVFQWQKKKKYFPAANGRWSVLCGVPMPN